MRSETEVNPQSAENTPSGGTLVCATKQVYRRQPALRLIVENPSRENDRQYESQDAVCQPQSSLCATARTRETSARAKTTTPNRSECLDFRAWRASAHTAAMSRIAARKREAEIECPPANGLGEERPAHLDQPGAPVREAAPLQAPTAPGCCCVAAVSTRWPGNPALSRRAYSTDAPRRQQDRKVARLQRRRRSRGGRVRGLTASRRRWPMTGARASGRGEQCGVGDDVRADHPVQP